MYVLIYAISVDQNPGMKRILYLLAIVTLSLLADLQIMKGNSSFSLREMPVKREGLRAELGLRSLRKTLLGHRVTIPLALLCLPRVEGLLVERRLRRQRGKCGIWITSCSRQKCFVTTMLDRARRLVWSAF